MVGYGGHDLNEPTKEDFETLENNLAKAKIKIKELNKQLEVVADLDVGGPGGLHFNGNGSATLYQVGIAKYKATILKNKRLTAENKLLQNTIAKKLY